MEVVMVWFLMTGTEEEAFLVFWCLRSLKFDPHAGATTSNFSQTVVKEGAGLRNGTETAYPAS